MYEECRHIKTSGTRCGSPALKGKAYCYFHFRTHQQRHRTVDPYAEFVSYKFDVAVLEDRAAIQLAISEVVAAMARDYMDHKRGGKILYGLQLALHGMKFPQEILAPEPVRDLCQNQEGEDIAPEMTVYEENDEDQEDEQEFPTIRAKDKHKGKEDPSQAKQKQDGYGRGLKILASCDNIAGAETKPKTLREAIANYISDLRRRHPDLRRSQHP
jgi:mannose-6-phosphate isomerase class I